MSWDQHVANGEAYSGQEFILGLGGLYPHVQLLNPVGSGKRVRLRKTQHTWVFAQGPVYVRRHDPAIAILGPFPGFVVANMLGGGPAPVAELRRENIVAQTGAAFFESRAPANDVGEYPPEGMEWGIDLLEGDGVLLQGPVAITLIALWEWVELPL